MSCFVPSGDPGAAGLSARPTRALELASTAWAAGEAAYVVGLLVFAYRVGGPGSVGLVGMLQALPSVVLAPLLMAATSGVSRPALAVGVLTLRVATVGLAAVLLVLDGPAVAVFALVTVDALASTLLRPIRGSLVPMIARSPDELVAANVAITTGASLASLVGPVLATVVLAFGGVETTFVAGAAVLGLGLLAATRIPAAADPTPTARDGQRPASRLGVLPDLGPARSVVAVIVGQRFLRGMLTVLVVTTSLDLLLAGDEGVGLLTAALGLGGVAGSALSRTAIRRWRLAGSFVLAVALWGAGVGLPAVAPVLGVAVAAFAVAGVGKALLEVAGSSLLQRTLPTRVRGQVLSVMESFVTAALAAGAAAASALVVALGPAAALLVAASLAGVLVVVAARSLGRIDDAAVVPAATVDLLRSVPFFRPLGLTILEDLSASLGTRDVPAGEAVVCQGEPGDRFYIVESGRLETVIDARAVRELGPGDSFGEIALLREVPRTATVRAVTPARMATLDRDDFLGAIGSHVESQLGAESVVRMRVDGDGRRA